MGNGGHNAQGEDIAQASRAARFGQTRPGLLLNQAPHSRVIVLMGAPSGH